MTMIESRSVFKSIWRLLDDCNKIRDLKQIHSQIITSPYLSKSHHLSLISRLLFFCAVSDSGSLAYASRVFQVTDNPNLSMYNAMIRAYSSQFRNRDENPRSLVLYKQMLLNYIVPDCITIPFILKECVSRLDFVVGQGIHAHSVKFGIHDDVYVGNSMISLYTVCGVLRFAYKVFDEMPKRDIVSWNSIIIGCLRSGELDMAQDLFMRMDKKNIITWNSVITGMCQGGRPKEAIEFFRDMLSLIEDDVVYPDKITLASVISACASLGWLNHGKWVHSYMLRNGIECDMVVKTAVVDMYGKCGNVSMAKRVFEDIHKKDVLAWTSMISVYALHGHGNEAFDIFDEMVACGVRPNRVTFGALLTACAHLGLVEKGRWGLMNERGLKKDIPGNSMIEVDGILYEFSIKGSSNILMEEIKSLLYQLSKEIKAIVNKVYLLLIQRTYKHNYYHLFLNQLLLISKMNTFLVFFMFFILTGFYYSVPFMLTVLVLVFLFLAVLLSTLLVSYFKELMSNDHRPPVVGSTLNMLMHIDHFFDYVALIAKKHHTFRFITPTHSEVYIADPINVEHILKSNFQNYTKGDHKLILGDLFGNGIFAADGDIWRHQRKLASLEFSAKVLRDFSTAVFRSNTAKLVKKVSESAVDKQVISLQDLLMRSTLDSIFKVGFGFDLDTLSGSDEVSNQFMTAFDDSSCIIFRRYVDLLWRLKRYFNIGSEAALKKNIEVIDNFAYELIERKKEQMKNVKDDRNKEDILSRFLIESEKNPANLTDQYLRDITLSFVIAGKDSTANTLTWFFYMLCKHKPIQEKVTLEVKEATGAEYTYSINEFSLKLTEAALDKMHYLHAALTETLRLYPAVPLDGKHSEKDDILPDGFKIKKGDSISYMPYPMGRMTYIWGEDAEEFRPERWLHDGVFQPESPFKFTAFQGGPRICLGKDFAYRQMKIMAAFLVFFFKFQLVDESKEATYRTTITLQMDKGLFLYAFPRSKP
ncbi:hypothetical protein SSX86_017103 [Deinandra increscens subsp. villosa]|uniref:Cytochrome P450 n=1 Tax=Deinandra increscens subsp. villosa TaxID=3103831 RepID=A0AAP0D1S4_9ASTR